MPYVKSFKNKSTLKEKQNLSEYRYNNIVYKRGELICMAIGLHEMWKRKRPYLSVEEYERAVSKKRKLLFYPSNMDIVPEEAYDVHPVIMNLPIKQLPPIEMNEVVVFKSRNQAGIIVSNWVTKGYKYILKKEPSLLSYERAAIIMLYKQLKRRRLHKLKKYINTLEFKQKIDKYFYIIQNNFSIKKGKTDVENLMSTLDPDSKFLPVCKNIIKEYENGKAPSKGKGFFIRGNKNKRRSYKWRRNEIYVTTKAQKN